MRREGCPNRGSPGEDDPLTKESGGVMRIEVLIDVKTVLGEGPLWDVDEQRLQCLPMHRRRRRGSRLGRAGQDRLDGFAQTGRRGAVAR
jgi:hypothetical protein